MILTTHAIAGAAVASFFPNHPVIAFSVAFVSHFMLDSIPHSQYKILSGSMNPKIGNKIVFDRLFILDILRIGADGLLGLSLALFIFSTPQNFWIILGGGLFGIFPDFLQFVYIKFRHQPLIALQYFHQWVHPKEHIESKSFLGFLSQTIIVVLIVLFSKVFHSHLLGL